MGAATATQLELPWDVWAQPFNSVDDWILESEAPAILVLDDDPLFAELFVEYARKEGHFASFFTNLRELGSLDTLKHYNVALVDFDLGPGLNGLKIAEIFKGFDDQFPVVLTTATKEGQECCFARSTQIEGFVKKQDGLASILNRVISSVSKTPK